MYRMVFHNDMLAAFTDEHDGSTRYYLLHPDLRCDKEARRRALRSLPRSIQSPVLHVYGFEMSAPVLAGACAGVGTMLIEVPLIPELPFAVAAICSLAGAFAAATVVHREGKETRRSADDLARPLDVDRQTFLALCKLIERSSPDTRLMLLQAMWNLPDDDALGQAVTDLVGGNDLPALRQHLDPQTMLVLGGTDEAQDETTPKG